MATIMSCSQSYAPRAKKFNQMTGRVLYFSSLLGAESASRQIAAPCMSGTTGTSAATLAQRPRGAVCGCQQCLSVHVARWCFSWGQLKLPLQHGTVRRQLRPQWIVIARTRDELTRDAFTSSTLIDQSNEGAT